MRDSTQACPEASTTTNTVMQTKTYEYMQLYMCQDMQSTSEKKKAALLARISEG